MSTPGTIPSVAVPTGRDSRPGSTLGGGASPRRSPLMSSLSSTLPLPPGSSSPRTRFLSPGLGSGGGRDGSGAAGSPGTAGPPTSRAQGSSSPHHPGLTGSYPMAQSRSWGTPTSDIRGTSPTAKDQDEGGRPKSEEAEEEDVKVGVAVTSKGKDVFESKPVPGYPLGGTRCYWSILNDQLDFVYVDPILQYHLGAETSKILGSSIYDYIHPDERKQASLDFEKNANASSQQTPGPAGGGTGSHPTSRSSSNAGGTPEGSKRRWQHGGVTRCRFARSSYVRKLLGCESPEQDPEAFKYTYDERYLPIKLVMSSIGVDLVLCFFHAAIDKDPIADNHEGSGQTIWSNWCGPSDSDPTETYFTPEQAKSLADALLACQREGGVEDVVNPPAKGSSTAVPPAHVFQILKNPGGDIIFSYPPSDLFSSAAPVDVKGGAKRYIPEEYAALAMDVCRRPKESNVAAKTNCTRRLKSRHPVMKDGTLMSIESVVIQYGSITFAFFSTGGVSLSRSTPGTGSAGQSNGEPMHATGSGSSSNSHSRKRQRTSSTQAGGNHQHFHQNAFQHHHHHQTHANNILNDPAALQTLVTMPWAHDSFAGAPSASEPSMGSGDLSPTLASAASVLGSFQNAAYSPAVQPASLPVEDPALSAPGSTALGQPAPSIEVEEDYDAFGLQHLAAMAMGQMGGDSSTSPTLENLTAAAASASASTSAAPTTGRSTTTKAPVSRPMPPQSQPIPPPGSERIPHVRQQRAHQHHGHSASVDLAAQSLLGIGQGFEFQPGDSGRAGAAASGSGAGQASKSSPTPVQYPTGQGPFAEFNGPTVNAQGLKACSSCGTANSPEWRKGPSGIKSLCNACGLRFSRAQARKAKLAKAAEAKKNGLPPPTNPKPAKKAKTGGGPKAKQTPGAPRASASHPSPPVYTDSIPVVPPGMGDDGGGYHDYGGHPDDDGADDVPWATSGATSGHDDEEGAGHGSYMVGV